MATRIYYHFIPWDEFNERFGGVDLLEADKVTEISDGIFAEAFQGDNSYDQEDLPNDGFVDEAYQELKKSVFRPKPSASWFKKLFRQAPVFVPEPSPTPEEVVFWKEWFDDFEFSFSRLMPYYFNRPLWKYQDSPVDFSPTVEAGWPIINSFCPQTVARVRARYPSAEVLNHPAFQKIVESHAGGWALGYDLEVLKLVVEEAHRRQCGLCSFIL